MLFGKGGKFPILLFWKAYRNSWLGSHCTQPSVIHDAACCSIMNRLKQFAGYVKLFASGAS